MYGYKSMENNDPMLRIPNLTTLRLRQTGRHFPDDIFNCIFLNENFYISFKISPKGPMNNIPAMFPITALSRAGDKPLSETMMALFTDEHIRHSASMS